MEKPGGIKQFFVGPLQSAVWGCLFLMILAGLVFVASSYGIRKDVESRLNKEYSKIEDQITNRMQVYANSLLGARAFLYRLSPGNQHLLNSYLQDMQIVEHYPGFGGIGYTEIMSNKDIAHESQRLSRFINGFNISKYSASSNYHAIVTMMYPDDWINKAVIGRDMMGEEYRTKAILESIAADKPILSDPIALKQGTDDSSLQTGFILFLPIYELIGTNADKTIQNTRSLVFMRFSALDLFSAVFGHQSLAKEKVGFSVESLPIGRSPEKLYDRFEQKPTKDKIAHELTIFGQSFRLTVYPMADFYSSFDDIIPYILSSLTLLISALVFLTIRNNSSHATQLEKSNKLLEKNLRLQKEKEEDLIILNRTLQQMSHSLEIDKIMKKFMTGVSDIFEHKGKFAIFSLEKNKENIVFCNLMSSNDVDFFVPNHVLNEQHYAQLLIMMDDSDDKAKTLSECSFLVRDTRQKYKGLCFKIDSSPFGSTAFVVFISTSAETPHDMESILFQALMKHFNASIQNSLLLKKVEDANQSKTAFLANMSHEIRTPLNAIMGFSEILIRPDIEVDLKKELSVNIIKNGKQLSRIVDDILDLSKIEAGKFLIDKKRVNIFEILQEIRSVMKMRANQNHNIDFLIEIDGKIPTFVKTDAIRLKQILMNLIGNSIKFTTQGFVRLRVSHHVNETHRHFLFFRVEDTGIGMDREFKTKLFEPFSQGDTSPTRNYGGTGLGLAISRRLANELGGSVNLIFSEKDMGTIFEVSLPIEELEGQIWTDAMHVMEDDEIPKPKQQLRLPNKKILLVEDSVDNQEFFNFFLTQAGAEVKIMVTGLDAVEEVKRQNYDLILMDIQLPGIDGKEATRRIRKLGFKGPIIALTAHAMHEEQESCLLAGCDGQISKPVGGEVFLSQVYNFIKMKGNHGIAT